MMQSMQLQRSFFTKYILRVGLSGVLFTGCRKFVQVSAPDTLLGTETVFSGDRSATAALMGMYSRAVTAQGAFLNGGNTLYPALSADECTPTFATAAMQEFSTNSLESANTYIATLYGSAYNAIYNANMLLENLAHSTAVSLSTRHQIMGEAFFVRALIYSRLGALFGDVPLVTSTNADVNAIAPRSPVADVYRQVVTDLHRADSLLDTTYVTQPGNAGERTRPNKWAARALMARVFL